MCTRMYFTRVLPVWICMWFLAISPPDVHAQESESSDAPATEEPQPDTKPETDWERLIYLPYKNLQKVFERESATVFMPYSQFLKMWGEKALDPADPDSPPVAAVISRADYSGKVEKDLAKITAKFTVQALGKPWAEIPLQFGDAAVGKMTASHEKILLRGTGEGSYALLFPEKGEHTVTLELVTRIRTSPDGRSFTLRCPPVGITNVELEIPAADQTVEITPHLVSTPVESEGNVTKVKAGLGATQTITARWHPRVSSAPEMELLASVENTIDIRVADGLIHTHASLAYQVLRGKLDQVRISVPAGQRILDVSAPALKGWQAEKVQDGQVITVDLLPGNSKRIVIDVHTERAVPDGPFSLAGIDSDSINHGIHARGAVREHGVIAVHHAAEITLPIETQTGLVRIESSEIPENLRRDGGMFFKFYTRDFDFRVQAKPVQPRVVVEQLSQFEFRDDEVHLTADLAYTIERAGLFELRYELPDGFKVDAVYSKAMEKYTVADTTGELVVALTGKTLGAIFVRVSGHVDFRTGQEKTEFKLPVLTPMGVTRETGVVNLFAPEAIELITTEDAVIAAQPIRPQKVRPVANMRLASSWAYTRRPMEITVTTLRKPTRLTAAVGTDVEVKQELTEVVTTLNYDIQYAGMDTFVFAVPEAVADVQIDQIGSAGTAIKQRSRAQEAVDGWVTWTVVMQRDVKGKQQFRVKYDLKPERDDAGTEVLIEPIRVLETPANETRGTNAVAPARVYGEVAIGKERSLSVSAATTTLEAIDVRELQLMSSDANLAYRYYKQPVDVRLTASKHEIQEVVETVVARALIEAVVTEDASTTYRCRYKIISSERQRLSIQLPEDAELLGVMVAGKRGTLERDNSAKPPSGWQSFFVNVAREGRSEDPFYLMVLFRLEHSATAFPEWGGSLSLEIPYLGGEAPAPVQQLKVAIWTPDEYSLVGKPDQFTNDRYAEVSWTPTTIASTEKVNAFDGWIGGESVGLFEFPIAGHGYGYSNLGGARNLTVTYWRSSIYTIVISGALFLVALLLSRTTWHNKLSVVVVAGFVMALLAVRYPNLAVHVVSAALPGIVVMALIWLVHSLFRLRPHLTEHKELAPLSFTKPAAAVVPPPGVFNDFNPPKGNNKNE